MIPHVSLNHNSSKTIFAGTIVISKFVTKDLTCTFHNINQYIGRWGYSCEAFCTVAASNFIQK